MGGNKKQQPHDCSRQAYVDLPKISANHFTLKGQIVTYDTEVKFM